MKDDAEDRGKGYILSKDWIARLVIIESNGTESQGTTTAEFNSLLQSNQAEDQPSSSAPLPSSSHPPVISATLAYEPTPVVEPTTHHPPPSPEPNDA
ncbi:hypothetical protein Tco_0926031 [Tanacetum coccineum]|uniref:Uncharacterized protein n=1 Tax=Tanacetum coccineum TaxID=301880 RepID=A0ABQ5DB44_9ASTR